MIDPPTKGPDRSPGDAARAALESLIARRSVSPKRMTAPGPSDNELRSMIAMALTAPDHGGLRPTRFIRIADAARERLARLFQEVRRRDEPDAAPADFEREREKALNGPCLLAVVGRIRHDHPKVPPSEQYASIGAAVMAVLVAAHLLGYGAIMLSGDRTRDRLLADALGAGEGEELVGFITIGSIARPPAPKPRPAPDDALVVWNDPPAVHGPGA